ncbi:MAG: outer membrane lipoprotein-sorting protein [Candidatus Saccharicenans sp.]|nr:outer membrane lipoprotein-sorting protein [Candidatus Saccharicenans sp.]
MKIKRCIKFSDDKFKETGNMREATKSDAGKKRLPFPAGTVILALMIISASAEIPSSAGPERYAIPQTAKLSGEEILKRVDDNITAGNKVMTAKMIIHLRRASRTVEFKSYIQGTEKAFTEFLAPPREKGTKMLKLGNQLWMYSPWTDRTILISGHMLRQSVMGSDLSYEDMMEDPRLSNSYIAEIVGEEAVRVQAQGGSEVSCWVLELTARQEDVAYPQRKLWVDKERYVVLREELYARGGTLLKKVEVLSLRKFDSRWVPKRAIFKDMLKASEGTEFLIESLEFDAKIPEHIFTRASLK